MNVFRVSAVRSLLLVTVIGITACGDSSGPRFGPPTTLAIVSGHPQTGQAGQALPEPLTVRATDSNSRPTPGVIVTFRILSGGGTLSASADTTDAEGLASVTWTVGPTAGTGRTEARAAGVAAAANFDVTVNAAPATLLERVSPNPGSSAAGFELPDSVAVQVRDQFGNGVGGVDVTFAVTAGGGSVSPQNRTTGTDGIARAAWTIGASGAQSLTASATGGLQATVNATAVSCPETSVAVGAVLTIGPTDPKCVVLTGSAQRYFVTVVNTTPFATAFTGFSGRGAGASTGAAKPQPATPVLTARTVPAELHDRLEEAREAVRAHTNVLDANLRLLQQMRPALQARAAVRPSDRQASVIMPPPPNVGDVINLKIPTNFSQLCNIATAAQIRARVVYSGTRGVVLEDSANAIFGQYNTLLVQLGQEFDNSMWNVLTTNFGDPLAMDAQTDNNQRVFMLFSDTVNTLQSGGIAGFVSSADFFSPVDCPASNQAEIFYARAPTVAGTGYQSDTPEAWYRRTRTVLIHELKHVVSFAERIKAGAFTGSFNFTADRWLEESSAMMAEELWARTIFGYTQNANVDYESSIYCEVRPTPNPNWPQCQPTKPLSMFDHFILLYDYESANETRTPIGATSSDDFTFYGSGWLFLRWVVDNFGGVEGDFLRQLTIPPGCTTNCTIPPGVQNIEARTGRSFVDLISDWSIAMALDDYPGFAPVDTRHRITSWNVPDIFAGMSADFSNQGFFTDPTPLQVRSFGFGKFSFNVSQVRGGTTSVLEVSGTQTANQLLEFKGASGTSFPAEMRVRVVRVQ